ncbi:hypothetical protein RIF29_14115 [Crotalaria pallida]|uniref:Protein kinase domain-containing protein n=1 Tax=Crotalaria pallida TaxID=3830 RepID=A0AAN9ICG5_CROPI
MGLGIGLPLLLLLIFALVYYVYMKVIRHESDSDPLLFSTLKKLPGTPREFIFQELNKATNNFDDKLKLGQGGFGVVYRGTLPKEKLEVAVKKFSRDKTKSIDDFLAELSIINRLRHKHLVRLLVSKNQLRNSKTLIHSLRFRDLLRLKGMETEVEGTGEEERGFETVEGDSRE